ncbi:MAG: AEC family transporter [Halofilum sp. (in: g-proteobacteria)]|nr:AEC family transporter [Halofilum sp. (in: g-proteobacteria)]
MAGMLLAIAPIFLVIALGHVLRREGIPSTDFWNLNDKLVYWVLFPSLLFYKMATMELTGHLLGSFALVIYAGFAAAIVFALASGAIFRFGAATWTSVIQGCGRHNTFIALAVAERLYGDSGLALAALITALLIPVTNVSVVTLMVPMLHRRRDQGFILPIARELMRNPILIAVALGIGVNLSGIEHIPVLYDMTSMLGAAALPIVLLCVGANIRVRAMVAATTPTIVSIAGKMIVFPLAIGLAGAAIELPPEQIVTIMIFGAVPTSAGAYTLARQMGGDAPGMAAIVTIQTAISFLTLPLTLALAQQLFGV